MKEEIIKNQIELFKQVHQAVVEEIRNPEMVKLINLDTVKCVYKEVNHDLRIQAEKKEILQSRRESHE